MKIFKYIWAGILCIFTLGLFSCQDVNDWGVDENQKQMFSPVSFESSNTTATSIDFTFSGVPNAQSYVFEFSEDSLEFKQIVRTITLETEDLVKDSTSTNKYKLQVLNLDGGTQYSVRLKVTSADKTPDSKYLNLAFKTKGEQIIEKVSYAETWADVQWIAGSEVTHIMLSSSAEDKRIELTATDIANGELKIENLTEATAYTITLYRNDKVRGTFSFVTFAGPTGDGVKYYLDGTENLVDFIAGLTDQNVILILPADSKYEILSDVGAISTLAINSNIKAIKFHGSGGGEKPVIKLTGIKPESDMLTLQFYNVELAGNSAASDYVLNETAVRAYPEISFESCNIHTFRGVMRQQGGATGVISSIKFTDCLISDIGGYGVFSLEATVKTIDAIQFSNNTLYNKKEDGVTLATVPFALKSQASSFTIEKCTFYNAIGVGKYFINFNGAANMPPVFNITGCLFGATIATDEVRGINPKTTTTFVYDSYKAQDLKVSTGYPFSGMTDYAGSSSALFTDPNNGDFRINDPNVGGGTKPGDPRWWN